MRKATVARGAVIERSLVQRKIRRMLKMTETAGNKAWAEGVRAALNELMDWLKEQPKRTARKGGIGRK